MIVADNGSSWYISGATDSRWNDDDLNQLKTVPGSALRSREHGRASTTKSSGGLRSSGDNGRRGCRRPDAEDRRSVRVNGHPEFIGEVVPQLLVLLDEHDDPRSSPRSSTRSAARGTRRRTSRCCRMRRIRTGRQTRSDAGGPRRHELADR